MNSILYIVIPCYNEETVLPITSKMFLDKLTSLIRSNKISDSSRILFVNDGSKDKTWEIICNLARQDEHFIGISQSRKSRTSKCGSCRFDGSKKTNVILRFPSTVMVRMISMPWMKWLSSIRRAAKSYTVSEADVIRIHFFKRFTAEGFYKLLNWMGAEVVYNHADYRLVSSRVLKEFANFKEVNLFLRGMFPLVGFKSTSVYYERHERIAGESHYPLSKMLALAFDGITSLSVKPIRIITALGTVIAGLSFLGVIWSIVMRLMGNAVAGWSSMICIICLLGGVQLVCLGVLGEYIGKIYMEVKHRPRYIISERTEEKKDTDGDTEK